MFSFTDLMVLDHINYYSYADKGWAVNNGDNVYVCSAEVPEYVIKAQILAGGRGKGVFNTGFKGGVHLTRK